MEELRTLVSQFVEIAVIRQQDDECIVPRGKGAQRVYKRSHTRIRKGESIQFFVCKPMIRHLERLVARESLKHHVPRSVCRLPTNDFESAAGSHAVIYSPLAFIHLRQREILVASQLFISSRHEISLLAHDFDVAAIKIVGRVSHTLQAVGYRGKGAHLVRQAHQADSWIADPSAVEGNRSTICAETVCIKVLPEYAFRYQTAKIGSDTLDASHFRNKLAAKTLHHNNEDVWTCCGEQSICNILCLAGVKTIECKLQFLCLQPVELSSIIFRPLDGRHQTENRIHSRMIEEKAGTIVGNTNIHRTFLYSTSYTHKEKTSQKDHSQ